MAASPSSTPQCDSGTGPVFATKDGCAYVRVRQDDSVRAVVNMSSMALVAYATPEDYPPGPLRCDRSLFVPIYCNECYGTQESHYARELKEIGASDGSFVVGMCSVYGVATGEHYPDSRQEYIVPNELAYSGACHPMPGRALFMHKAENDIGLVKCYWHVHSRSSNKTFLYCCVARADTEYAAGVVKPETNVGFSLGTTGDNAKGPVTEECSLVSWPMRPGCFCVLVSAKDLAATMTRMGFSVAKTRTLDAGANPPATEDDRGTLGPLLAGGQGERDDDAHLSKIMSDQLAEIRVLKDMLEAMKVQNHLFTRLLKGPDKDALFTLRGAEDFSRRTGVETKLCAGDTDIAADTQVLTETRCANNTGHMAATQAQMEELLKLLQKQQPQQQDTPYANPYAAAYHHAAPGPLYMPYPHLHPQNPASFYRKDGLLGLTSAASMQHPAADMRHPAADREAHRHEPLTAEQRREIAMAYNREEAEKQAVIQKQQELMIESITANIKDALKNQAPKPSAVESQPEQYETLRTLARDMPYKRTAAARKNELADIEASDIAALMRELREIREMTKDARAVTGNRNAPDIPNATDPPQNSGAKVVDMETESGDLHAADSRSQTAGKQQAGYSSASQTERGGSTKEYVTDFISAVVSRA